METKFKSFGTPLPFPLDIDADWVRIHCGVDGDAEYIFGIDGVKEFYAAGTGIWTRVNGKPTHSLQYWIEWYEKEREERIKAYGLIQDIKELAAKVKIDFGKEAPFITYADVNINDLINSSDETKKVIMSNVSLKMVMKKN